MNKSVHTAIGALLQDAQKLKLPYTLAPNSVMNKALQVYPDDLPASTPWVQYAAIGIGALSANRAGANGSRLELKPIPHQTSHTGLYQQIPFVIRPIAADLSTTERQRFRLRKISTIRGEVCASYYLRVLDLSQTQARLEYRVIEDGTVTSTPWEPTADDQFPTPWTVNPGQVLVTGDDYIATTAKSTFSFTPWDMNELINVGVRLFDSDNSIIVSELAICSGVDADKLGDFNGVPLQYREALGVQITDFVSTFVPAAFNTDGASINLDIGSVEPLLALKSSN